MSSANAGWEVYSKLVLQQLEDLNNSMGDLRSEIQTLQTQVAELRGQQNSIEPIKQWKERIDDIMSPSQLDQMKKEVEDLKQYKTKSTAIFAFVQFLMTLALFYSKVMS